MQAHSLKGMSVMSMPDGAKLGTVKQVLFDAGNARAAALLLTTTEGEALLPYGSVRTIGADAVMAEHPTATYGAALQSSLHGLRDLDDLIGLQVLNSEGIEVGQVDRVDIEPTDGRITQLAVHRGGHLGMGVTRVTVEGSAIRGIGEKSITVEAAVADAASADTATGSPPA